MLDKQHEECGVIGVFRPEGRAAEWVHRGLHALQHRGQEGAGIVSIEADGEFHARRGFGLGARSAAAR